MDSPSRSKVFLLGNVMLNPLPTSDREELIKPFSLIEVEDALRRTESSKAPGPDGVNVGLLKLFGPI